MKQQMTAFRRVTLEWKYLEAAATFECICGQSIKLNLHRDDYLTCECGREYVINPPEIKVRRPKEN